MTESEAKPAIAAVNELGWEHDCDQAVEDAVVIGLHGGENPVRKVHRIGLRLGRYRPEAYDNIKTAVETIFVGKDRQYNRRFLQMCSHHLVEPVACTPASGWEKGQVENQVGLVRERFFTLRLQVKSYDELNAWLMDKSIAWAKAHPHPERRGSSRKSVPSSFLIAAASTDSMRRRPRCPRPAWCGSTTIKYSVSASAVDRPVEIHAYADRVVIRQDGRIVAEHPRCYGRGEMRRPEPRPRRSDLARESCRRGKWRRDCPSNPG